MCVKYVPILKLYFQNIMQKKMLGEMYYPLFPVKFIVSVHISSFGQ